MCGVRLNTEENYICQRVMGHQRHRKDCDFLIFLSRGKMKFKYTNDEIQQILDPYGVKALEYISTKNVIAVDSCGYKYKIVLTNLLNREKLPHRYRGNPFALYNLSVYLKQNGSSLMVLSSDYSNCNKKIEL